MLFFRPQSYNFSAKPLHADTKKLYLCFTMKKIILTLTILLSADIQAQSTDSITWNTPTAGNPILPGYFADPTIRKFGDTYYIYATTDGTGASSQPPQVWASKDFVNWQNYILNWPVTNLAWAPDVVQQPDGTFRYYYCTSECVIREGQSQSPVGPFTNVLGEPNAPLIGNYFVPGAITLDPHLFRDDDEQEYLYFGTWGIYKDHGCGVAKLNADGKTFGEKRLIPNTEIKDFFEAPWVFKRKGVYYFLYSSGRCEDETYAVQYATGTHPMGPYEWKGIILQTNADGTVHGPGHNSVLQEGEDYYIVYHRHNNPLHSTGGYNRQTAIDKLEFDAKGNILPINPTHKGIVPKGAQALATKYKGKNLAFGAKTTASSYYNDAFLPKYATDDNNGTLWRAMHNDRSAWLQIDLGQKKNFDQIFTQFEYATFFYQYKIEISSDGNTWKIYADRSQNHVPGSPMVDTGQTTARYVRITVLDTQHRGHFPAIWNVRIYQSTKDFSPAKMLPNLPYRQTDAIAAHKGLERKDVEQETCQQMKREEHIVLHLNADDYKLGSTIQDVPVVAKEGKTAFRFNGKQRITLTDIRNKTLIYNSPYTISAWVFNPEVGDKETIIQLMNNQQDRATVELRNGTNPSEGLVCHYNGFHNAGAPRAIKPGRWQHWLVSYDGLMERIYCNGQQIGSKDTYLNLRPSGTITIGASSEGDNPFSGYLHSVKVMDIAVDSHEALRIFLENSDMTQEQRAQASEINFIKDLKPQLSAKPISPQQVRIAITNQQGESLANGLFEFAILQEGQQDTVWTDHSEQIIGVEKSKKHVFTVLTRDVFGHKARPMRITLDNYNGQFINLFANEQKKRHTLKSKDATLGTKPDANVPMHIVEIEGDFVLQCRIEDMSGLLTRNTPAYNEAGILILTENDKRQQHIVHLGAFPAYNCGNMLTVVHHGRPQFNNSLGYNFHRYMQLERRGNLIYARTSSDGRIWEDMPHSPVDASFLPSKVKAGIYQCTYTPNEAAATFGEIWLWKRL